MRILESIQENLGALLRDTTYVRYSSGACRECCRFPGGFQEASINTHLNHSPESLLNEFCDQYPVHICPVSEFQALAVPVPNEADNSV